MSWNHDQFDEEPKCRHGCSCYSCRLLRDEVPTEPRTTNPNRRRPLTIDTGRHEITYNYGDGEDIIDGLPRSEYIRKRDGGGWPGCD